MPTKIHSRLTTRAVLFKATQVASANLQDDLGGPKRIDEFYRWNARVSPTGLMRRLFSSLGIGNRGSERCDECVE